MKTITFLLVEVVMSLVTRVYTGASNDTIGIRAGKIAELHTSNKLNLQDS